MSMLLKHLRVASNSSYMLGNGYYSDRENNIAAKAFECGVAAGRMQVATADDPIAPILLSELGMLHVLIDWGDDTDTRDRIGALLARARGVKC